MSTPQLAIRPRLRASASDPIPAAPPIVPELASEPVAEPPVLARLPIVADAVGQTIRAREFNSWRRQFGLPNWKARRKTARWFAAAVFGLVILTLAILLVGQPEADPPHSPSGDSTAPAWNASSAPSAAPSASPDRMTAAPKSVILEYSAPIPSASPQNGAISGITPAAPANSFAAPAATKSEAVTSASFDRAAAAREILYPKTAFDGTPEFPSRAANGPVTIANPYVSTDRNPNAAAFTAAREAPARTDTLRESSFPRQPSAYLDGQINPAR